MNAKIQLTETLRKSAEETRAILRNMPALTLEELRQQTERNKKALGLQSPWDGSSAPSES